MDLSCAQPKLGELGGQTSYRGRKLFPTPPDRNMPLKIAKDSSASSPGQLRSRQQAFVEDLLDPQGELLPKVLIFSYAIFQKKTLNKYYLKTFFIS